MRNTLRRVLSALSFYDTRNAHEEQFELGDDSMKDTQPMVLRSTRGAYYIGILKNTDADWETKARISKEFYHSFSDAQTSLMRNTYTKTHITGDNMRGKECGYCGDVNDPDVICKECWSVLPDDYSYVKGGE